ncbi:MAG: 50S ribosomal protein L24 [Verrucomicrobia bacterium]|nr:50S ribosomal protein L24 [Verrucomicrobiota bacterium]
MITFHVHKGDEVKVISGSQRGRQGKILEIQTDSSRAVIEGINMIKKHVRPTQDNPKGGIMEREGTVHISNLKLISRPTVARTPNAKKSKEKPAKGKK